MTKNDKFVDLTYNEFLKIPILDFSLCSVLEVPLGLYRPCCEHEYENNQARAIYELVKINKDIVQTNKYFVKFDELEIELKNKQKIVQFPIFNKFELIKEK